MTTALLLIATGEVYHEYARGLIASAKKYFAPHETCLFTDSAGDFGVYKVKCPSLGYPTATLKRYHLFLTKEYALSKFDNIFYIDVDALFVQPVGSEIFGHGITVVRHKGYNPNTWDFFLEDDPRSAAYMPYVPDQEYYAGGFNGGSSGDFLQMSRAIRDSVDQDEACGIMARWHDESHLNKYLSLHKPARVLGAEYCYPETELYLPNSARIVCLEKACRER